MGALEWVGLWLDGKRDGGRGALGREEGNINMVSDYLPYTVHKLSSCCGMDRL